MTDCNHDGFQSGQGRYDYGARRLRYVIVCDTCQQELREVHAEEYQPSFDPRGNDEYLDAA